MSPRSQILRLMAALMLPLSLTACNGDGNGNGAALSPDDVELFLLERVSYANGFFDGLSRLAIAIGGGFADGVTITPMGNVVNASVDLDIDGDGTRESTIGGSLTFSSPAYNFADGANLQISNIDSPGFGGSLTATATEIGTGTIEFIGSASFPITSGPTASVPSFGISVTSFANFVFGFAEVEVGGLSMDVFFEEDGLGSWQMRVVGSDFQFVI